mgnify:CR=1 FL=1
MEIRGAGSLFGFKQSGGGGSVGYEMYLKLIQRSFHKSDKLNSTFTILPEDVIIEIYNNRLIPNHYVSVDDLRLSFYKNIVGAMSLDELDSIVYNISNRFGVPPMEFNNLIKDFDEKNVSELIKSLEPEDLLKYGLIPEFIGRMPILATLENLNIDSLVKILKEPKNSLIEENFPKTKEIEEKQERRLLIRLHIYYLIML